MSILEQSIRPGIFTRKNGIANLTTRHSQAVFQGSAFGTACRIARIYKSYTNRAFNIQYNRYRVYRCLWLLLCLRLNDIYVTRRYATLSRTNERLFLF